MLEANHRRQALRADADHPTLNASTIRVLGGSGSIAAGSRTTSFLLDDDILIDAGTGVDDLTLDEMAKIDHIFAAPDIRN